MSWEPSRVETLAALVNRLSTEGSEGYELALMTDGAIVVRQKKGESLAQDAPEEAVSPSFREFTFLRGGKAAG